MAETETKKADKEAAIEKLQQDLLVNVNGQDNVVRGHIVRHVVGRAFQEVGQHAREGDYPGDIPAESAVIGLAASVAIRPARGTKTLIADEIADYPFSVGAAELLRVRTFWLPIARARLGPQNKGFHFRTFRT